MDNEKQLHILACMADVLQQNGYKSELVKSDDAQHPHILRLENPKMGKVQQDILIEMCFIPIPMPGEDIALLQYYATIFTGVPEQFEAETKRAAAYCNDVLTLLLRNF